MGRSVAVPPDALVVVFTRAPDMDETVDYDIAQENLDYAVDCLANALTDDLPSLHSESGWLGRESRIIAVNDHAVVSIAEYCGIVAVAVTVNRNTSLPALAEQWIRSTEQTVRRAVAGAFGETLEPIATSSNGETFFRRSA